MNPSSATIKRVVQLATVGELLRGIGVGAWHGMQSFGDGMAEMGASMWRY